MDQKIQRLLEVRSETIENQKNIYDSKGWTDYWKERLRLLPDSPTKEYYIENIIITLLSGEETTSIIEIEKMLNEKTLMPILFNGDPLFKPLFNYKAFTRLINRK